MSVERGKPRPQDLVHLYHLAKRREGTHPYRALRFSGSIPGCYFLESREGAEISVGFSKEISSGYIAIKSKARVPDYAIDMMIGSEQHGTNKPVRVFQPQERERQRHLEAMESCLHWLGRLKISGPALLAGMGWSASTFDGEVNLRQVKVKDVRRDLYERIQAMHPTFADRRS